MSVPTRAEVYSQLTENLRKAQENAATLAHLCRDDEGTGRTKALGWLAVSEAMKRMLYNVVQIATKGRLN